MPLFYHIERLQASHNLRMSHFPLDVYKSLCHLCVRPSVNQQTQHPLFLGTQWLDDRSLNGALRWLWQGLLRGGR